MNIALILAGGTGTRLGGEIPKQYLEVAGRPVIAYCLDTFMRHEQIDAIQIVAEGTWHPLIQKWANSVEQVFAGEIADCPDERNATKLHGFSKPGENRQLSILNGLRDILEYSQEEDVVIIHDAARPLVSERIITDCLEACKEHDGALTALPVKDTIYYGTDGRIESLLNRSKLIAGQAPEAFRLGKYYRANVALLPERILQINGSTEPAVLADMDICCVAGDEQNFKITTKEDLVRFEGIMQNRSTTE